MVFSTVHPFKDKCRAFRRCILGRYWKKNLKDFAPCYSQSPPPADFTGFLGLEISIATAEIRWGLVFFISVFNL